MTHERFDFFVCDCVFWGDGYWHFEVYDWELDGNVALYPDTDRGERRARRHAYLLNRFVRGTDFHNHSMLTRTRTTA